MADSSTLEKIDPCTRRPRGGWHNVWRVTPTPWFNFRVVRGEPYGENLWLSPDAFPSREIAEQKALEAVAAMPPLMRLIIEWEDAVFIEVAQ